MRDALDLTRIARNDSEAALAILRARHRLRILRDEDIKIALKLQDDRTNLVASLDALGLEPNDPTDD